jgi:hypothetical protein
MQVSELHSSVREPFVNTGFYVEYFQIKASSTNETTGKCFSVVPAFIIVTQRGFTGAEAGKLIIFKSTFFQ